MKSHFDGIYVCSEFILSLELSKSSFSCQCSFSSVSWLFEVDVFEHPRFLMNSHI